MRKYGNTLKTLQGVEAKVNELNTLGHPAARLQGRCPTTIAPTLVETTLHTVFENLTIGMALVFLVLIFFLGNLRQRLHRRDQHTARAVRRVHPDARAETRRPT